MGDNPPHLGRPHFHFQRRGHDELGVVHGIYLLYLPLIPVHSVEIPQEYRQFLVVQTMGRHLSLLEGGQGGLNLVFQLALVAVEEHQVKVGGEHLVLPVFPFQGVDTVVDDLDAGLQLLLGKDAPLIAALEGLDFFILSVDVAVQHQGPLNLHQVGGVLGAHAADDAAQGPVDGIGAPVGAEKAELHRRDLDGCPKILPAVGDAVVVDLGDLGHLLDVLAFSLLFGDLGLTVTLLGLPFAALPDGGLLLFGYLFIL